MIHTIDTIQIIQESLQLKYIPYTLKFATETLNPKVRHNAGKHTIDIIHIINTIQIIQKYLQSILIVHIRDTLTPQPERLNTERVMQDHTCT